MTRNPRSWILVALALAACAPTDTVPVQPAGGPLVVYSGRREALLQPVLDEFSRLNPNIGVIVRYGDNVELANALLEEGENPQADVFVATEMLTVEKLYQEGALAEYASSESAVIPERFRHPESGWTPLTLRARVLIFNTDWISPAEAPRSVFDLVDPIWRGRVAAAGSTNGSMQAHVAVIRQLLGEDAAEAWLQGLIDNQVTFFGGHTDVRKSVGAGEFAVGLVNHYYYHLQLAEGSPVGVVYPDQADGRMGLVINAAAAGIVRGSRNLERAQMLIDFLLADGQQLFAELNFEYPIDPDVPLAAGVSPLREYRIAEARLPSAAEDMDAALEIMEEVGLP